MKKSIEQRNKGRSEAKPRPKTVRRKSKKGLQDLADGLLISDLIPEGYMKLFNELWNESEETLPEGRWNPDARKYKPTRRRVRRGIPQDKKNRIDAKAEQYATVEHYRWEVGLTTAARGALETHFSPEKAYGGFRDIFLQQLHNVIDHLVLEDKSARLGSAKLESRLKQFTADMHGTLRKFYGLTGRAARRKENLHRSWSRMKYEGLTGKQIADLEHDEGRGDVTETHVNTSVTRYRKRREPVQWVLRYLIYHAGAIH